MPSPIAHAASGYALSRIAWLKSRHLPLPAPILTFYAVFIACCPDLDFLPQLMTGIRFHRGPSHSLLAAFVVSGLLAWLLHHDRRAISSRFSQVSFKAIFSLTFYLYLSHLALDLLTAGGSGIPLFWPLSRQPVQLSFVLFPAVHHSRGLIDSSHLIFVGAELLYTAVLMIGLRLFSISASDAAR